jgi:hypothetical protein
MAEKRLLDCITQRHQKDCRNGKIEEKIMEVKRQQMEQREVCKRKVREFHTGN